MKRLLSHTLFLSATLLVGSAIPARASIISILFTGNGTGAGGITTAGTGTNTDVTSLTGYFVQLVISNTPSDSGTYSGLYIAENFSSSTDTLTVTGSIASLAGLSATTTLATIQFSGDLTANTTGSGTTAFTLNTPPAITSIALSSTLLSDLGISGVSFLLANLTATGSAGGGGGVSYNSTGGELELATAIPEPTSGLMMTFGLALFAFLLRRRFSRAR